MNEENNEETPTKDKMEVTLAHRIELMKLVYAHFKNDFDLYWVRTKFFILVDIGLLGFYSSGVLP